jgi:ATP-dependent Clp protease ATP-binding subunit ClpC
VEIQKQIEAAVISQQYKKATKLKEKVISLEEEVTNFKKKFSIPKEKRLKIDEKDIRKVLSIST